MKLAIAALFLAAVASASSWGRDGERGRGRDGGRDRGNNEMKKYYCDENYRCGKGYVAKHDFDYECNGKCDKRECCEEDKYYCDEDFKCGKGYVSKHNNFDYECNGKCDKHECCKKEEYYCDDIKCGRGYEKKHGFNYECDGKCDKRECCKEEKRNNGKNDGKWKKGDNDKRNNGKRNRNGRH